MHFIMNNIPALRRFGLPQGAHQPGEPGKPGNNREFVSKPGEPGENREFGLHVEDFRNNASLFFLS